MFLALYYAVLIERNPKKITVVEVLLFIWIAAFACDEFGEFRDAGTLFYAADFWSLWDIGIVGIGFAFLVSSGYSYSLCMKFSFAAWFSSVSPKEVCVALHHYC